jgi:acyl-CoA synthetase (AMP-forming)/AMP-acid ligase II
MLRSRPAAEPAFEADLVAWCRSRMAGYKVPRSVIFVSELPLNAAGKVDKPLLAQIRKSN